MTTITPLLVLIFTLVAMGILWWKLSNLEKPTFKRIDKTNDQILEEAFNEAEKENFWD